MTDQAITWENVWLKKEESLIPSLAYNNLGFLFFQKRCKQLTFPINIFFPVWLLSRCQSHYFNTCVRSNNIMASINISFKSWHPFTVPLPTQQKMQELIGPRIKTHEQHYLIKDKQTLFFSCPYQASQIKPLLYVAVVDAFVLATGLIFCY